jgi:hypothetical protein
MVTSAPWRVFDGEFWALNRFTHHKIMILFPEKILSVYCGGTFCTEDSVFSCLGLSFFRKNVDYIDFGFVLNHFCPEVFLKVRLKPRQDFSGNWKVPSNLVIEIFFQVLFL